MLNKTEIQFMSVEFGQLIGRKYLLFCYLFLCFSWLLDLCVLRYYDENVKRRKIYSRLPRKGAIVCTHIPYEGCSAHGI